MPKATFSIFRFAPQKDETPYYQDFQVEIERGMTILDCLHQIKWYQDGTLAFRRSCRSAICGSCGIRIDGNAKLACKTQALEVYGKNDKIVIEPLKNFPVLKDLVVDMGPFFEKIKRIKPWLISEGKPPEKEYNMSPEELEPLVDTSECIMCGCCYSSCTVYEVDENFLGPAAIAKSKRFIYDIRDDKKKERLEEINREHGIWFCDRCYYCVHACPKAVAPKEQIMAVRLTALTEKVRDNIGTLHVKAFTKSVKKGGRLNEATVPIQTAGIGWALKKIPLLFRLPIKGKAPYPWFPSIPNVKEIKKIYEIVEHRKRKLDPSLRWSKFEKFILPKEEEKRV